MLRRFAAVVGVVCVVAVVLGCAKVENKVIATVGNKKITVGEVANQYSPQGLTTPEQRKETKQKLLNMLIDEKLQLSEAEARGYDKKEEVTSMLEEKKKVLLVNQLYKIRVADRAKVSPAELKKVYALSGEELSLGQIVVGSEDEAKLVRDSLKAGASFEALAMARSTDTSTKDKGGSLGWVRWGRLPDNVFSAAFALKKGDVSAPIKTDQAYYIVRLADRRKTEQKPFEEEKKRIESRLKQSQMRTLADDYLEALKKRSGIKYNDDVVKDIASRVPVEKVSPWAPAPLPTVTDDDKKKILLTASKKDWTVGMVMEKGEKAPPRSPIDTPEGLKRWVDMIILQELLIDEAVKAGVQRSKEVKDELQRMRDIQMINLLHRDEIEAKSNPTPEEVKAYFRANKDKYAIPEKNTVSIIVTTTQDQAKELLAILKKGANFEKIAKDKSIHPSKQKGGDIGVVSEARNPGILAVAKQLKVGRLSDVVQTPDGYCIVKLRKREPMKMRTFDEAQRMVERDLMYQNNKRLNDAFLAELKNKYPVKINEQMLDLVGKKKEQELMKKEAENKKTT